MNSPDTPRSVNVELLFREGQEYQAHHSYGKALELFTMAAALKPDHAGVHYQMGVVLGKMGRWNDAARAYETATRLQPEHTESHVNLGFVYYELGRDTEARAEFDRAKDLGGLAKSARKMPF
jgi:Flp pilus assembly protein TadD